MTTNPREINVEDLEIFFQVLNADPREIFTFWWLREDKTWCSKAQFGNVEAIKKSINETLLNGEVGHLCLHTSINRTNDRGRSSECIQSCRVFCVDLDNGKISREKLREIRHNYKPTLIVESSPGKYHIYWKLDSAALPLEVWEKYQLGLANYFDGDRNLSQRSHGIRVPGIPRIKNGEMVVPRVLFYAPDEPELKAAEVVERFPWINEYAGKAVRLEKSEKRALKALILGKKYDANALPSRDRACYDTVFSAALSNKIESLDEAYSLVEELWSKFPEKEHPFTEVEAKKSAKSAWRDAQEREEQVEKTVKSVAIPKTTFDLTLYDSDPAIEVEPFGDKAIVARTRIRFGEAIARIGSHLIAFDPEEKTWTKQKDSKEILSLYADKCIEDCMASPLFKEYFAKSKNPDQAKEQLRNANAKFTSQSKIQNIVELMKCTPCWKRVRGEDFDKDPNKLFIQNGVLDLKTLEVRDAIPEDYLLLRSEIEYNPEATCERWQEFLKQVFARNDNPEKMISFIQEVFGYSLTGRITERVVFLHVGGGSNGKSTVLGALRRLMGDYTTILDCTVMNKSKQAVQGELNRIGAKIEGKRVVIIDDLETASQWNDSYVKNLTSDRIVARRLYDEERDVANRAKFHIGCNEVPRPETESHAILRRMCLIPYKCRFQQNADKEAELNQMIEEEIQGILNWAIEGCQRLMQRGRLDLPEDVQMEIETYKEDNFKTELGLETFFLPYDTEVEGAEEELVVLDDLVNELNSYLDSVGANPVTNKALGRFLTEKMNYESDRKRVAMQRFRRYRIVKNPQVAEIIKRAKFDTLLQ